MQLTVGTALLLATALLAPPASACSLAVTLGGTLKLSADGTRLGSDEGGTAATLSILNLGIGAATISVAAPQLASAPAGFDLANALVQLRYQGGGLLSGVTQPYTGAASQFQVPALLSVATVLLLDNRITSPHGFAAGTYETRTVVTCS